MGTRDPRAEQFWAKLATIAGERGTALSWPVRFVSDTDGRTPAVLVLEGGKPRIELPAESRQRLASIDPDEVASRITDSGYRTFWRGAFERKVNLPSYSPNEVCELLFGPFYRADRTGYASHAVNELCVDPTAAASWVEGFVPNAGSWPRILDLIDAVFPIHDADESDHRERPIASGSTAPLASLPPFDSLPALYRDDVGTRDLVRHNVDIWRRVHGALQIVRQHPHEFDPWPDYWYLPERRILVSYFDAKFHQGYAPAAAMRRLAHETFSHFQRAREAGQLGGPVPAEEQPALWRQVCDQFAAVAADLGASRAWDELRRAWPKLGADGLREDLLAYIEAAREVADPGDLEDVLFRRLPWFPYLGLRQLDDLRSRQLFFGAYYALFTSTNAYKTGGALSFAPVLQNNRTGELLEHVLAWSEGRSPAARGFEVEGRSTRADRSGHAPVIELFGFLTLHRQPFFNNAAAGAYRSHIEQADGDVYAGMARLGEETRTFLETHPTLVGELSGWFRGLVAERTPTPPIILEGVRSKSLTARFAAEAPDLAENVLLRQLDQEAAARAAAMGDPDAALAMLHLILDAAIFTSFVDGGASPGAPGAPSRTSTSQEPEPITGGPARPEPGPPVAPVPPRSRPEQLIRLPATLRRVANDALAYLHAGFHVLLAGAPGTGKTTLAQLIGHAWNVGATAVREEIPLSVAPPTTVGNSSWSPFHTIGGIVPDGRGGFAAHRGIFIAPDARGGEWRLRGECLVLDEMNRADLDRCIGELYPLLSGSVERVHPAGIPGVETIATDERFRIVATVNDATLDDIVFPISEGLARRFLRIELMGARVEELEHYVALASGVPERRATAEAVLREFFELCGEQGKLTSSDLGEHLPFGVGYFAPLRAWVANQLRMSADFQQLDPEDQARQLLATSLRSGARLKGFDEILRRFVQARVAV